MSVDEESLEELVDTLSIPKNILQALSSNGEFEIVVPKILEYVHSTKSLIEEYASTVREFEDNLEERERDIKDNTIDLDDLNTEVTNLKAIRTNLQEQNENQEEELGILRAELTRSNDFYSKMEEECDSLKRELHNRQVTIEELEEELEASKKKIEELKPPPDIPGADREELLRLLERKRNEILRLSEDWKTMADKLETTLSSRQELQSHLDDLIAQETSLKLREQLLSQEKRLVQQQNEWLSEELENKSNELLDIKKQLSTITTDTETRLSSRELEIVNLNTSLETQKSLVDELQGRLDSSYKRLLETKEEQSSVEDQLRRELTSQSKLATMYQSAAEEGEKMISELMTKLEKLQSNLECVNTQREEAMESVTQLQDQLTTQQYENEERIKTIETELFNANNLLTSARHRGLLPMSDREVLSLSPMATETSSLLESGMTLTQIYTRYVESTDQLRELKDENSRLNNYLSQIMKELDEKTPSLQKLRRDHDILVHTCEEQQNKIENVVDECESFRQEAEETIKHSRSLERENKRLKNLTGDLGRQVQLLLKECEEARGGVASSSHAVLQDVVSDSVTSSSQVISDHLVTFRSIQELQEQNQRLLAVVRELGEEREREEHEHESDSVKELRLKLDEAQKELEILCTARERQQEKVEAIVKQRDMYRILLAQSTPLPTEDSQLEVSRDSARSMESTPQKTASLHHETLQELKEQFEIYRKEKSENDRILQEQINKYREEASNYRLDNTKLVSKLEYSNERYQMLDSTQKVFKNELVALRNKESQLTSALTKHQVTVDKLTQELFESKEKVSRLEISYRTLKSERDMLYEGERRARQQYEDIIREQRSRNILLTNLQTIQNNLERNEYETKHRLTTQLEGLEKENTLLKDRLHGDDERRNKMRDAYETQMKDITIQLEDVKNERSNLSDRLLVNEETIKSLSDDLQTKTSSLLDTKNQLEEAQDRLRAMEDDAGTEFRSKIRLLERKLSDANAKVTSIEDQLKSTKDHCEQYRMISDANEKALSELNITSEEFKNQIEKDLERLRSREAELITERDKEIEEKMKIQTELQSELEETQEALCQTQNAITDLQDKLETAENKMYSAQEKMETAIDESKKYCDLAREQQEYYQRELVQHGRTMEDLANVKLEIEDKKNELCHTQQELSALKVELETFNTSYKDIEKCLEEENKGLQQRNDELTTQNELLHSESEKMSARIVTLTQPSEEVGLLTFISKEIESDSSTPSDHLWEVIRFVKREKEIAETKREIAEGECSHLKLATQKLERQLKDTQTELRELSEATKAHEETTSQYNEVMTKVQTLNILSDSNALLREERDKLKIKVSNLEERVQEHESQIHLLREDQRSVTAIKDSLLAEKAALRNEVERWKNRTNQLMEQYNKIDPDEYKLLVEERDNRETEMKSLHSEVSFLKNELEEKKKTATYENQKLLQEIEELKKQGEVKGSESSKLQTELKSVKDDMSEKIKIIGRLREVGRKYRSLWEEVKKECEEIKNQKVEVDNQKAEAEKLLEEAKQSLVQTTESQHVELQQQLDQVKQELDTTKLQLVDKEDKFNKVVKTARSLRAKCETLKTEKELYTKENEDIKNSRDEMSQKIEEIKNEHIVETNNLQEHVSTLQEQYDTDTRKLEEKINKLEQELKSKRRRVVPPQVVESPSTTVTLPSAAVKPTVTTTPTASIRPMPLQTTTAPTAHVTPTQVTTSIPVTTEATPTQSANQVVATVFLRSTSPLVQSHTRPQITPTSSDMSINTQPINERPKRTREISEIEFPTSKRSKRQIQIALEAEPSTTTDHNPTVDQVESSDISPDTQTDRQTPDDQVITQEDVEIDNIMTIETRLGETDIPATTPADTTSDEATEPVEETGSTDPQVNEMRDDEVDEEEEEEEEEEEVEVEEETSEEREGGEVTLIAIEPIESAVTEESEIRPPPLNEEDQKEKDVEVIEVMDDEYTPNESEEEEEDEEEEEMIEIEEKKEEFVIHVELSDEEEISEEDLPESQNNTTDETTPLNMIGEESVGLPDDEVTVDIPTPITSQNVSIATTLPISSGSVQRLRLGLGDRAITPSVDVNILGDDHQVPCTPVLSEDKQLGKNHAQSVPGEQIGTRAPISNPPEDIVSHDDNNNEGRGITLGEIQLSGVISSMDTVPDQTSDDTGNGRIRVGEDGDIVEEGIDEIIGQNSSDDDDDDEGEEEVEEGELTESQTVTMVTTHEPPTQSNLTSEEIGPSTSGIIPTSSESGREQSTRRRIRPIIWDQPSTSTDQKPTKVPKTSGVRRPMRGSRGHGRGRGRARGK